MDSSQQSRSTLLQNFEKEFRAQQHKAQQQQEDSQMLWKERAQLRLKHTSVSKQLTDSASSFANTLQIEQTKRTELQHATDVHSAFISETDTSVFHAKQNLDLQLCKLERQRRVSAQACVSLKVEIERVQEEIRARQLPSDYTVATSSSGDDLECCTATAQIRTEITQMQELIAAKKEENIRRRQELSKSRQNTVRFSNCHS